MHKVFASVACVAALAAPALALAQGAGNYPNKPIIVVVPVGPGGATDVETRVWTTKMTESLGQQFVLEYKAGAGTTLGLGYVAKAKPDGYTLGVNTINMALAPLRNPDLGWDPVKSFEHISVLDKRANALAVHASLPIRNIKEYIAYARAHPGELNMAASGEGSVDHIAGVWLMSATNTKLNFIHYKNSNAAYTDLMVGRVQMVSIAYSQEGGYPQLVKSGKMRNIGTASLQRSPMAPDVPTLNEQGVADYEIPSFLGLLAPPKTPVAIVNKLHDEVVKASKTPEVKQRLGEAAIIVAGTPAEFRQLLTTLTGRFSQLAKEYNIEMKEE